MRVIAGIARRLQLRTPDGIHTRPTTDRIKETIFNMIQSDVQGSIFVDVFAGSGGIGIEALSRGAEHAYFIENEKEAISCILQNLAFTKLSEKATLLKQDVTGALSLIHEKEVTIIFMDPPYQAGYEQKLFGILKEQSYVTKNTLIIYEADLNVEFGFFAELGFEIIKEKKYKTNRHIFVKRL